MGVSDKALTGTRRGGGSGRSHPGVQGSSVGDRRHGHLGQESFFLERLRTRQKPEMLGGGCLEAGYPRAGGKPTLPRTQVAPPVVLGTPQALGAESLSQTGFCWDFLEMKRVGQESCSPRRPPAHGHSGARPPPREWDPAPSPHPVPMGEAGTSVGVWAAEGKAWVRRGRRRNGYAEWGAPRGLGAPETQRVTTAPAPGGGASWHACSPSTEVSTFKTDHWHTARTPNSHPAMGPSGTLAFNLSSLQGVERSKVMLSHPAAAPSPYKALVPGEGKFHLGYEKKKSPFWLLQVHGCHGIHSQED